MRKLLFLGFVFYFLLSYPSKGQVQESTTLNSKSNNFLVFARVWGFLKYHHPQVAKGNVDWDSVFLARMSDWENLSTRAQRSDYCRNWFKELNRTSSLELKNKKHREHLPVAECNSWILDSISFEKDIQNYLMSLSSNQIGRKQFYVSKARYVGNSLFKNEKLYPDSAFLGKEMRMLTLCRYWNIIHYFFPYNHLIDEDWDSVFVRFAPRFLGAGSKQEYLEVLQELTASIDDSHSRLNSKELEDFIGNRLFPFYYRYVEDKFMVYGFYNDSLCNIYNVRKGDVLIALNGESIEKVYEQIEPRLSGSNNRVKRLRFCNWLTRQVPPNSIFSFSRGDSIFSIEIDKFTIKEMNYKSSNNYLGSSFKLLNGNMAYLDITRLHPDSIDDAIKVVEKTLGLIIDVRGYPQYFDYSFINFLLAEPIPFVRFSEPSMDFPGTFEMDKLFYVGRRNKNAYKGKVIILCNEGSQSASEYLIMQLQAIPGSIVIGSPTSGADGNVSHIPLPGGVSAVMSGLGVLYANYSQTQRVGIVPDYLVEPTMRGLLEGRDEVLERAQDLIRDLYAGSGLNWSSIERAQIIGLAEEQHGYESVNEAKSDWLAKASLKKNSALIFESSFCLGALTFLENETGISRMESFLYPYWLTGSVKEAISIFEQEEEQRSSVLGMDIQEDCRFKVLSDYLLRNNYVQKNRTVLLRCDSILEYYIGEHFKYKTLKEKDFIYLKHGYDLIFSEAQEYDDGTDKMKLLLRCIYNRMCLVSYLNIPSYKKRMEYRDYYNFLNVKWIKEEYLQGYQLFIWAAALHLEVCGERLQRTLWMGDYLRKQYGNDYEVISFRYNPLKELVSRNPRRFYKTDVVIEVEKLTSVDTNYFVTPCR